ncbi:MAG: putative ABC transporter permease [Clostridiales bacterium]|jgi:hypothetical protein|nr:putative ABC transporter permease [Clostridiales bacterium]
MRKNFKENSIVYLVGAAGYTLLEVLWRGYSHWTMAVTGGLCFVVIYRANLRLEGKGLLLKCLTGAAVVTAAEFAVGAVVNLALRWNVWDYSALPLNFLGQICALYSLIWFLLGVPLAPLCRWLRKRVTAAAREAEAGGSPLPR